MTRETKKMDRPPPLISFWKPMSIVPRHMPFFVCLVLVGGLLLATMLLFCLHYLHFVARRSMCESNLRNGLVFQLEYAQSFLGHEESEALRLKPTIADYAGTELLSRRMNPWQFNCPGAASVTGAWTNVDIWMDYAYVSYSNTSWLAIRDQKYPIMYDKSLSNHSHRGINVLLSDGSVIWDPKGRWLARFTFEHPDLDIKLPDGVGSDNKQ